MLAQFISWAAQTISLEHQCSVGIFRLFIEEVFRVGAWGNADRELGNVTGISSLYARKGRGEEDNRGS